MAFLIIELQATVLEERERDIPDQWLTQADLSQAAGQSYTAPRAPSPPPQLLWGAPWPSHTEWLKSNRTAWSSAQPFLHHCFPFWALLHLINGDANQKPKSRPGADPDKYNLEEAQTDKELILQQGSDKMWGSISREWEGKRGQRWYILLLEQVYTFSNLELEEFKGQWSIFSGNAGTSGTDM